MKLILIFAIFIFAATANAFDAKGCRLAEVDFVRHDTPTTYWVSQGLAYGSLKIVNGMAINREGPTLVNLRVEAITQKPDGEWIWVWTQCL